MDTDSIRALFMEVVEYYGWETTINPGGANGIRINWGEGDSDMFPNVHAALHACHETMRQQNEDIMAEGEKPYWTEEEVAMALAAGEVAAQQSSSQPEQTQTNPTLSMGGLG